MKKIGKMYQLNFRYIFFDGLKQKLGGAGSFIFKFIEKKNQSGKHMKFPHLSTKKIANFIFKR
jgi:hypothetical protein